MNESTQHRVPTSLAVPIEDMGMLVIDPARIGLMQVQHFDAEAGRKQMTSFMTRMLALCARRRQAEALLLIKKVHSLTPQQQIYPMDEIITDVCTEIAMSRTELDVFQQNPQVLTMFVPGYGEKRLNGLMIGLLLAELCLFTKAMCARFDVPCTTSCSFSTYDGHEGKFHPQTFALPVGDEGLPQILIPRALLVHRIDSSVHDYWQQVARDFGGEHYRGALLKSRALSAALADPGRLRLYFA